MAGNLEFQLQAIFSMPEYALGVWVLRSVLAGPPRAVLGMMGRTTAAIFVQKNSRFRGPSCRKAT